jgi:hypothetical protein
VGSIPSTGTKLQFLTLSFDYKFQARYQRDEVFRNTINQRRRIVEASQNSELKNIVSRANNVIQEAIVLNAGGWFIFVVPIAICHLAFKRISKVAKDLIALPALRAEEFFPIELKPA